MKGGRSAERKAKQVCPKEGPVTYSLAVNEGRRRFVEQQPADVHVAVPAAVFLPAAEPARLSWIVPSRWPSHRGPSVFEVSKLLKLV